MVQEIIDGVIIVMLMVTITYAMRLSSKLNLLRNQKQDFANNIRAFQEATEAAIIAVEELHIKGENVCKLIDEKIKRASLTNDEIEFITDRARKTLMGLKASETKPVANTNRYAANLSINSLAEAQLMKALREREYKEALNG